MKNKQRLLFVVLWVMVLLALERVLSEVQSGKDVVCEPSLLVNRISDKFVSCVSKFFDPEKHTEAKQSGTLVSFRNFLKDFCLHVHEVTTCLSDLRNTITNCVYRNVTRPVTMLLELGERLLVSGCENDGEKLAFLSHNAHLYFARKPDFPETLRRCLYKQLAFTVLFKLQDIPLGTMVESYVFNHELTKLNKCFKYLNDERYKSAAQWLLNEIAVSKTCKHPEQDVLVTCSEIDESKVPIKSICQMKPFNTGNIFDLLVTETVNYCNVWNFNDVFSYVNSTHEIRYREVCIQHRELPKCMLEASAFGETCLAAEEDRLLQLLVQAVEDNVSGLCTEDGAVVSSIRREIHDKAFERASAVTDCRSIAEDSARIHQGQAVLRFYHRTHVYKQCVVDKLQETVDIAQRIETIYNNILNKMKCINSEDDAVVPCETIHEH